MLISNHAIVKVKMESISIRELSRMELEAMEEPAADPALWLSGGGTQLWNAFFRDPAGTLEALGRCSEKELQPLGQVLWSVSHPGGQKLLSKGYAAVNTLLSAEPQGSLRDAAYEFLLMLEWNGGYRDLWVPAQPFNYPRLFDKWTYSDGALAAGCMDQMESVFNCDPGKFLTALAQWDRTAEEYRDAEAIALHFAYSRADDETYLPQLEHLLKTAPDPLTKGCVELFIDQYRKAAAE